MLMNSPSGGSSAIFGPDGRMISQPTDDKEETIIYADLDMDQIVGVRMFADCTGHYSRPDLFHLSVNKEIKTVVKSQKVEETFENDVVIL